MGVPIVLAVWEYSGHKIFNFLETFLLPNELNFLINTKKLEFQKFSLEKE